MSLNQIFCFQQWKVAYRLLQPYTSSARDHTERTLVFIHGTPWSSIVFRPLANALLARGGYQILLYDLAGYGLSQELLSTENENEDNSRPEADTSVKTQALLLSKLLDHLRSTYAGFGEAPDIIAHDIAGVIALRAHLLHGCKFRSLFLMDTNAVLPWGDGFYKLVRSEPETFRKLPPSIYEAVVRAVIRSGSFDPRILGTKWEDALGQPWLSTGADQGCRQRSFVRQIAQANDADVEAMLDQDMYKQVQCPVKIIWGEEDRWIPREKMERLAEMLRPSGCLKDFVTVQNAGHLIMIDQPERIASELLLWLAQ